MYKKLRDLRIKNNMSLVDVANSIGISKTFYFQIENGQRRLLYENAVKIAKIFNVKPDYLFYDDTLKNINEKDD
jgi:putative transcriptional regulator